MSESHKKKWLFDLGFYQDYSPPNFPAILNNFYVENKRFSTFIMFFV